MDGLTSLNSFLAVHKPQLILSGVPEHFWPTLCKKIRDQIFDSGLSFQMARIDYEDDEKMPYDPVWALIATREMDNNESSHIYLIDHAWTFKPNSIKNNLRNVPGLLERMSNLMQVNGETVEERIVNVSKNVWRYAHTYAIGGDDFSVEDRVPVWYVLDELGSAVNHSDSPNFRAVPFIHVPDQMTYSLLFPVENVQEGDRITRNYVEGHFPEPRQREAMLIPWQHYDHFYEDFTPEEPDRNYFLEGHIVETLPDLEVLKNRQRPTGKLKVFSEYRFINDYLNTPEFEIVYNENEADILWYLHHYKSFEELSKNYPNKYVNQFPFEYVITIKDLLAIVSRRCSAKYEKTYSHKLETYPLWLPTTFNMKTELAKLVSCYTQRQNEDLDNYWICKPYNLARGLDTYITDNLCLLCRLPASGPKIAQKYIEDPVLFDRPDVGHVKFDIRYVVLLKYVNPTEVYVYHNFFLRFANKAFALDNFEDYEQHFTVMNYTDGVPLYRMLCADFKDEWERQYANHSWAEVEKSIFKMFAELFSAATSKNPPYGIAKSPQSRALYAADIMLSWHRQNNETVIQPKLLEMNWMPDCQRACEYYPQFYNDIFSVMFLDKQVETCTKVL
ncbi:tubulin--tyrosine ligase-like protein 12 [Hyposmocoma kahamanoa]|uniref:tubulin--tyrosine ligase-like protein 12 n=1 Tax=Hyposmocoma kahamanoa TaxID=1477025 RepID=UPI000E6D85E4|nr:tubulin--tyrosine ligase-like protein 12 [Hyposmocoma kahamanoa]